MAYVATFQAHHETSLWPFLTGLGVLLLSLALLAWFPWQRPLAGVILVGGSLALLAVGLSGWARESFLLGTEEGLGPVAVAAFIISEVIIFGTLFVAFWLARIDHAGEWASWIPANLNLALALWLTLILWASSATIVLSERAFTRGNREASLFWLAATLVLGALFVVLHVNEWGHLAAGGFRVGTNAYATTFYGLTGVHTSHVVVGLASLLLLFGVVAAGLMKAGRATFFRGAGLYWHFVDIMWLMVASNAYLVGGTP